MQECILKKKKKTSAPDTFLKYSQNVANFSLNVFQKEIVVKSVV